MTDMLETLGPGRKLQRLKRSMNSRSVSQRRSSTIMRARLRRYAAVGAGPEESPIELAERHAGRRLGRGHAGHYTWGPRHGPQAPNVRIAPAKPGRPSGAVAYHAAMTTNGRLAGTAAIVTGSARNIGRVIALYLAEEGAAIVVNGLSDKP